MLPFLLVIVLLIAMILFLLALCGTSKNSSPVVVISEKRPKQADYEAGIGDYQAEQSTPPPPPVRKLKHKRVKQQASKAMPPKPKVAADAKAMVAGNKSIVPSMAKVPAKGSKSKTAQAPAKMAISESDSLNLQISTLSSVKSTGSGYYHMLMKKLKVKSVSQYGM